MSQKSTRNAENKYESSVLDSSNAKCLHSPSSKAINEMCDDFCSVTLENANVDTIGLEAALKLLPTSFSDATQEDIDEFLEQCEFALACVHEKSKPKLLQGIVIRLNEKARRVLKAQPVSSWTELKEKLKKYIKPPTNTTNLLYLDLYSCRKKLYENVLEYSKRVKKLGDLILTHELNMKTEQTAVILETSIKKRIVQVFIEGLGDLKKQVLAKNPSTLDQAIKLARAEEKSKVCSYCYQTGHKVFECYKFFSTTVDNSSSYTPPGIQSPYRNNMEAYQLQRQGIQIPRMPISDNNACPLTGFLPFFPNNPQFIANNTNNVPQQWLQNSTFQQYY